MNCTNRNDFFRVFGALTLFAVGAASCSDDTVAATTDYAYDDAYLYDGYYPADVAYSGYYWADSWDYAGFYYLNAGGYAGTGSAGAGGTGGSTGVAGAGGMSGSTGAAGAGGGSSTTVTRPGLAGVIEAIARGETVCSGVTVTQKTAAPACAGANAAPVRNGVTIVFNNCQLTGGGTLNGTFDVQSNRSASAQTCSPTTSITLGHTTTVTNLSYTSPTGAKIVIPSQTDTGSNSYTFGQTPTMIKISTTGELQLYNSAGTLLSDHTYMGDTNYSFTAGNKSYSVDGTMNVQEKNSSGTATVTRTGLTRSAGCCRPTGGTVVINRTGGIRPGQATWSFGPSCGAVMRNGVSATVPACL